jgi:hypothetical protein
MVLRIVLKRPLRCHGQHKKADFDDAWSAVSTVA